ncbi:MAG: ABC-2 family transporter protein [Ilumatobacter sp.]|nr:ABC-2 family transporter protein [Ilumatobacter sp.]
MTATDTVATTLADRPIDYEPTWRAYIRLYGTLMRTSIAQQFQYRTANYLYMIGMIAEPVVYLVVWQTIAEAQGGEVGGYTAGTFAAYYIVWTLVRNMNIVFTPFGWEERIREGQLSAQLVLPVHPIHYDLGSFAGWKVVVIALWLPIAGVLALVFRPTLDPTAGQIVAFAVAIWGAYLIRSLFLWLLGMLTFFTTRVTAIFEAYFAAELLLSGRLIPMALMPEWVQTLAMFLPFESTFGFPITALVGPITQEELVVGLLLQLFWIVVGAVAVRFAWRGAVKHYTAVSG